MLLAMLLLAALPLQDNPRCVRPAPAAGASTSTMGPHVKSHDDTGPWVTREDYPPAALRAREEGTVLFTLDIDTAGCPTRCTITQSSGFSALDDATCPIMLKRARFKPAVDGNGVPITATWSNKFRWMIQ